MINFLSFVLIFLLTSYCSFNDAGGFWSKEKDLKEEEQKFSVLYKKKEITSKEFNESYDVVFDKSIFKSAK